MSVSYTLHAAPGNFRAFKGLIAAEYNGVDVAVADFDAAKVKFLSPTGRAPVLEVSSSGGPASAIFGSNAIARHLARLRRDSGLVGSTLEEEAEVDAWVDFATNDIELPATVWVYPVCGYMPFNDAAYAKAKKDLSSALAVLDKKLAHNDFLVGSQITLADIACASALIYPMKLVCDSNYLKPHGNVVRWFLECTGQAEFKRVMGDVVMCKKEIAAKQQ